MFGLTESAVLGQLVVIKIEPSRKTKIIGQTDKIVGNKNFICKILCSIVRLSVSGAKRVSSLSR